MVLENHVHLGCTRDQGICIYIYMYISYRYIYIYKDIYMIWFNKPNMGKWNHQNLGFHQQWLVSQDILGVPGGKLRVYYGKWEMDHRNGINNKNGDFQ